jgi:hypothetical protein
MPPGRGRRSSTARAQHASSRAEPWRGMRPGHGRSHGAACGVAGGAMGDGAGRSEAGHGGAGRSGVGRHASAVPSQAGRGDQAMAKLGRTWPNRGHGRARQDAADRRHGQARQEATSHWYDLIHLLSSYCVFVVNEIGFFWFVLVLVHGTVY